MEQERCPECGAILPPDVSAEQCPSCLMQLGLKATEPLDDSSSAERVGLELEAAIDGKNKVLRRLSEGGILAAPVAHLGERIGAYRVLETLGEGGMGIVYLAEQEQPLRRRVALKVIKLGMDTREVVARFESERQVMALMDHPNIASVLDAGATDDGRPYFVMEYVPGIPVTEYCDAQRLSTRARLQLFAQVCTAIQHAHQKGIIHRDLKPTNVLVMEQDGQAMPKVIDFGIAKAIDRQLTERTLFTAHGLLVGTPEYMSPEQASLGEEDLDTRTDIYSLGVLLYELLVGALPFDVRGLRRAGYDELRRIIREQEPVRPSTRVELLGAEAADIARRRHTDTTALRRQLRGDLDWITLKAMEKSRARRYPSASELASDVLRHLNGDAVAAGPPSVPYRAGKFVRKHIVAVSATVVIVVALAVGLLISWLMYSRAKVARVDAERHAYAADISAIELSIQAGRPVQVEEAERRLVEVPPHRRGWEWRYLVGAVDASMMTLWGSSDTYRFYAGPISGPSDDVLTRPTYRGRVAIRSESQEVLWSTTEGLHVWSLTTQRLEKAYDGRGSVYALAADGSRTLSSDRRLSKPWRVIEVKTGATLSTLDEPDPQAFRSAAFSRSGQLATLTSGNRVDIWSGSGQRLSFNTFDTTVSFLKFATDAPLLLGGVGPDLFVWSFENSAPQVLVGAGGSKLIDGDANVARDIAVGLDDGGAVRSWQLRSGKLWWSQGQEHSGARALSLSHDGRLAATGSANGVVKLFELPSLVDHAFPIRSSGSALDSHDGLPVDAVEFSLDGTILVSASIQGVVRAWDLKRVRLAGGISAREAGSLFGTESISSDGKYAAFAGRKSVSVFNLETLETRVVSLATVYSSTQSVASSVSLDGDTIAVGRSDGTVLALDSANDRAPATLARVPGRITAITISDDGRRLAVAWSEIRGPRLYAEVRSHLRLWSLHPTPREERTIEIGGPALRLRFISTTEQLLVTVNESASQCPRVTRTWDLASKSLQKEVGECAEQVIVSADGERKVVYTRRDRKLRVLNRRGAVRAVSGSLREVVSLAIHPDGTRVAVRTAIGVDLFDLATLQRVLAIPEDAPSVRGSIMQFSADGSRLVIVDGGLVKALDARPSYDPELRTKVREALRTSVPELAIFRTSPMWVHDVEQQVTKDTALSPDLRRTVIAEIRRIGDRDVVRLCGDSADIVMRREATQEEYQRAVRNAARGVELAPWSAFCVGTLGMAKYRVQDFDGALEALNKARTIRGVTRISEVAFGAMALQRLGRRAEALSMAAEFRARRDESLNTAAILSEELTSVVPELSPGPRQ